MAVTKASASVGSQVVVVRLSTVATVPVELTYMSRQSVSPAVMGGHVSSVRGVVQSLYKLHTVLILIQKQENKLGNLKIFVLFINRIINKLKEIQLCYKKK